MSPRPGKPAECALMHRRRNELALEALEMIEPLDRAVELQAFLGTKRTWRDARLESAMRPIADID